MKAYIAFRDGKIVYDYIAADNKILNGKNKLALIFFSLKHVKQYLTEIIYDDINGYGDDKKHKYCFKEIKI